MARILIAEDDRSMLTFITQALENAGHEVVAKNDGLEALAALEADKGYDLLLTDIVMPGMDGIELSQKVVARFPQIKVMYITGFTAVAMEKKGQIKRNAKMLSKPFHLNDLVKEVEALLSKG